MAIQPPVLPFQASGMSFVWSRRRMTFASTFETPLLLITATTTTVVWDSRNGFCYTRDQYVTFSSYSDPVVTNIGVLQSPVNLRLGASTLATARVTTDPTVTDFGSYIASMLATPVHMASSMMLLIDPGHSLLVTATASANPVDAHCGFRWYETKL
jgi:hypothetical protein